MIHAKQLGGKLSGLFVKDIWDFRFKIVDCRKSPMEVSPSATYNQQSQIKTLCGLCGLRGEMTYGST